MVRTIHIQRNSANSPFPNLLTLSLSHRISSKLNLYSALLQPPKETSRREECTSTERAEAAVRLHTLHHGYSVTKAKIQYDKRKPPTIGRHDLEAKP